MKITKRMVESLSKEYPGKKIICLPKRNPKEVVCEVAVASDGSWSLAVALIAKSIPHYHQTTWEVYRVLKGAVRLMDVTKRGKVLLPPSVRHPEGKTRESFGPDVIWPSRVHCAWAIGRYPAKVLVLSTPAWNPKDHHLLRNIKKPFILD
jgi:hypothetical protein